MKCRMTSDYIASFARWRHQSFAVFWPTDVDFGGIWPTKSKLSEPYSTVYIRANKLEWLSKISNYTERRVASLQQLSWSQCKSILKNLRRQLQLFSRNLADKQSWKWRRPKTTLVRCRQSPRCVVCDCLIQLYGCRIAIDQFVLVIMPTRMTVCCPWRSTTTTMKRLTVGHHLSLTTHLLLQQPSDVRSQSPSIQTVIHKPYHSHLYNRFLHKANRPILCEFS